MKIVICTIKSWNIRYAKRFCAENESKHHVYVFTSKEELSEETLESINPDYVFFPHWSYIIPARIFERWRCIVFHMTDLPFGRGGSPLQNLIQRGIEHTKLSAIEVCKGIDTGPIYMKEDLCLHGSADEIFIRASTIIFTKMIPAFLDGNPVAVPQEGEPVLFKRRTPEQSAITSDLDIARVYDHIRMLDGEGYPPAFFIIGKLKYEITRASFSGDQVLANVRILEVDNE